LQNQGEKLVQAVLTGEFKPVCCIGHITNGDENGLMGMDCILRAVRTKLPRHDDRSRIKVHLMLVAAVTMFCVGAVSRMWLNRLYFHKYACLGLYNASRELVGLHEVYLLWKATENR
jgi:hypothetical protein